jgi:hypothetical protein
MSGYDYPSHLRYARLLPTSLHATKYESYTDDKTGFEVLPAYELTGNVKEDDGGAAAQASKSAPPHVAIANLRTETPGEVETFVRKYGLPFSDNLKRGGTGEFRVSASDFEFAQTILRRAWKGVPESITKLSTDVESRFIARVQPPWRSVDVKAKDLWTFAEFLALLDIQKGRLGVCGNPDCAAPYFVAKRKTQRLCALSECSAFGQRQYALKWWNAEGAARRRRHATTEKKT